jgi:hypothetical protein
MGKVLSRTNKKRKREKTNEKFRTSMEEFRLYQ